MGQHHQPESAYCLRTVACMANRISQGYDNLSDDPGVIASWLLECVERHFVAEEAFLESNKPATDPEKLTRHKLAHKDLIQTIARFVHGTDTISRAEVEELVGEIRGWVERYEGVS